MATGKKTKGKSAARRKKTRVTKTATRRKTTTVRKAKTIRKKPANATSVRRASPKKARPTAKVAVSSTRARPPARSTAAKPAQPAPREERIGVVTHYYNHLSVAILRLESGTLRVGDVIHVRGHTTDFRQKVESLEVDHAPATEVGPNDDFGLKVVEHAREHDVVYKVRS